VRVLFTGGGTGGHLYPALAIARALVALRPEVVPHFIGARRGIERDLLPGTGFAHTLLDAHPLYRTRPWRNWQTVVGLATGWRRLAALAGEAAPRLVVATGGYASGPTLAWAAAHRVPYVLQEQNAHMGATNRWFARWATEVLVGFPEAAAGLSVRVRSRAHDVGNPIQPPPDPRPSREAQREHWGFPRDIGLVVLAFGGSQGSAALNRLVASWVEGGLPPGVGVIWGTGAAHHAAHQRYQGAQVQVRSYLNPIGDAYAAADLAVARAGAMTTAELCAWGIPMFLVPLPTAAADHQTINARSLAAAGAAAWVREAEVKAGHLDDFVGRFQRDARALDEARAATLARGRPRAAQDIAHRLVRLLDRPLVTGSA
jgi:UDP-N-acetylglucosamine--N-acetylmuramyl-(pentapeptide) pyrophosphoryl-undecaprenol N-acetylglucosamine transferase